MSPTILVVVVVIVKVYEVVRYLFFSVWPLHTLI